MGFRFPRLFSAGNKARERKRRAVVTGIGVLSPIGIGRDEFWQNLLAAKTGVDRISLIDASGFPSQIGAEVKNFRAEDFVSSRKARHYSRPTLFALAGFQLAKKDAGIEHFDPYRTDVILGTATSEFGEFERQIFRSSSSGRHYSAGAFEPQVLARIFINGPACAIALEDKIQGLVTTLSSACASALNAIGIAVQRIQDNRAEVVIAGGTDCGINYFSLNSFCATDSLATNNDSPEEALCPFDQRHTKSVLGEAAAIFIVEELQHALARGVQPYAEIVSYRQENENTNELYLLDKSGERWARVIRYVVEQGGGVPEIICAHGPSDALIDAVESKALRSALGARLTSIPVTSVKGSVGSPLGAAGGLQLAMGLLALKHKVLPPTYNYKIPDPNCPLDVVSKPSRVPKLANALINGHGFGGVNTALMLREVRV